MRIEIPSHIMKGLVNASPQDLCLRIRTGAKGFGLTDRVASPQRVTVAPKNADAWPDTDDLAALWNALPLRNRGSSWEKKIQNLSDAYVTQLAAASNSAPVLPEPRQLSRIALYVRFVEPGSTAAQLGVPNAHSTEADSVLDSLHTQVEDMQRIENLTTQLTAFVAEVEANPLAAANLPVTNPEDWAVIHDLVMRLEKSLPGSPMSSPLAEASLPVAPVARPTARGRKRSPKEERQSKLVRQQFGTRLKELREMAGMSVTELAEAADMLQPNISRYEAGKSLPLGDQIARLARALKKPPGELFPESWRNSPQKD